MTAMDDDFNTPMAISIIFKCVDDGNKILEKEVLTEDDYRDLYDSKLFIKKVSDIFSLNFKYEKIEDSFVLAKIRERESARENKDFKKSDQIRKELLTQGIIVEDTKEGPVWRKKI